MNGPLKLTIEEGQDYFDEPVYVLISKVNQLAQGIGYVFGKRYKDLFVLDRYKRVYLRWMMPGKDGALVPRKASKNGGSNA